MGIPGEVKTKAATKVDRFSGRHKNIGLILAGFDPVAVDAVGSELLGHNAQRLEYLALADGRLGSMDHIHIVEG